MKLLTGSEQRTESVVLLPGQVHEEAGNNVIDSLSPSSCNASPVTVSNMDSYEMASVRVHSEEYKRCEDPGRVLVLNFANSVHPGGGVHNGAKAQEEDLCRRSSLLFALEDSSAEEYYNYNSHIENYRMGSDAMILTPTVEVIKNANYCLLDEPFTVSVLTCAAPNISHGLGKLTQSEYEQMFYNRIMNIFQIAFHHNYKFLVLGAWGCGAFGNDPAFVSGLFDRAMKNFQVPSRNGKPGGLEDCFETVDFAVLDKTDKKITYHSFVRNLKTFSDH